MEPKLKEFIEAMLPGVDVDTLPAEAVANLKADMEGKEGKRQKIAAAESGDPIERRVQEADRRKQITQMAEQASDEALELGNNDAIIAIREARNAAINNKVSAKDFSFELRLAKLAEAPPKIHARSRDLSDRILEAAVCQAGSLKDIDKRFDDQTLQLAHDRFKGRIGLKDLYIEAAQSHGYGGRISTDIDTELHNAAMGMARGPQVRASTGWTTISLPNVFQNVANLFLRMGWMAVDQTPLRIAATRPVRNFQQITTVSLTGGSLFEEIGPGGEIPHGQIGEEVYNNQAKTRGLMYAITREHIINDDLNALTAIPRRLGRSGMLTLSHVFWTKFLNNSTFFTSARGNVNEGVATMTSEGLAATEVIFMNQTDPDGNPLLAEPAILLVPTAHKTAARQLMTSEKLKGDADGPDENVWRGRFRVESSPYLSNTAYTGNSAVAWYMLADPNDIPVIEIVALNGRIEPIVETADATFNVLGVQMRGYNDIGVELQEYRGGVRADGGAS